MKLKGIQNWQQAWEFIRYLGIERKSLASIESDMLSVYFPQ